MRDRETATATLAALETAAAAAARDDAAAVEAGADGRRAGGLPARLDHLLELRPLSVRPVRSAAAATLALVLRLVPVQRRNGDRLCLVHVFTQSPLLPPIQGRRRRRVLRGRAVLVYGLEEGRAMGVPGRAGRGDALSPVLLAAAGGGRSVRGSLRPHGPRRLSLQAPHETLTKDSRRRAGGRQPFQYYLVRRARPRHGNGPSRSSPSLRTYLFKHLFYVKR